MGGVGVLAAHAISVGHAACVCPPSIQACVQQSPAAHSRGGIQVSWRVEQVLNAES